MGLQKRNLYSEMRKSVTNKDIDDINKAWAMLGNTGKACLGNPAKAVPDVLDLIRNNGPEIIHFNGDTTLNEFRKIVTSDGYRPDMQLVFGPGDKLLFDILAKSALCCMKSKNADLFFTNDLPSGFSVTLYHDGAHQLVFGVGECKK